VTLAVSHESRNGQDYLHFAVRDTGIGIPVEQQQSVFEPFTQADNTLARTFGGTGLGLALAQRLTQLLRGRIWIESEPGKGSRFHLMVPAECSVWPGSGYLAGETIQQLTH
jgi:signal transduction histidine kinase